MHTLGELWAGGPHTVQCRREPGVPQGLSLGSQECLHRWGLVSPTSPPADSVFTKSAQCGRAVFLFSFPQKETHPPALRVPVVDIACAGITRVPWGPASFQVHPCSTCLSSTPSHGRAMASCVADTLCWSVGA